MTSCRWPRAPLRVAAVVAAHVGGIYGLLQIGAVREAVRDRVPIFAGLIQPTPSAPEPPAPAPPPVTQPPVQRAAPAPIVAAPPAPESAPAKFAVDAPPPHAIVAPEAPPAPPGPSAPVRQPRTVSATDVGDLKPPRFVYPSLARRLGEEGRVTLRVLVDPGGVPAQILVASTSGYTRRSARFLSFLWNASTLEPVGDEIATHSARDPFSHLAAHAMHAPRLRQPTGGARMTA